MTMFDDTMTAIPPLRAAELERSRRLMADIQAKEIVDMTPDHVIAASEMWPVSDIDRVLGCGHDVAKRVWELLKERRKDLA